MEVHTHVPVISALGRLSEGSRPAWATEEGREGGRKRQREEGEREREKEKERERETRPKCKSKYYQISTRKLKKKSL
jgi:hypothetical protein